MSGPTIDDILGIEQTKLGYFQEWQLKMRELHDAHSESERQRNANAAILDGITDLMMVLDENLRILAANKVFEELFPGRKYLGEFCHTLFCGTDAPCEECPAFLSLSHGTVNRETAIFPINGTNLHFDMVASPLPPPSGAGRSVLVFKRDVTREKKLQAQIYQAEKMASIGTLAAGVAHEINNPLTAVAGFAEGIRRRIPRLEAYAPPELAADIAEYTNTILRECARCRDIVQALVNFSRPLPSRAPVCLATMIEETLSLLRHTLKQYERVLFCLDLDTNLPQVWVDDTQVRQVLLNLVTNALDVLHPPGPKDNSGHAEGTITIRTAQEDGYVVLQVEDTGMGVLPQHLATVFEPFFTTKPKGLGLGLSVCYSVVQAHGGDISLVNGPDNKTRATVRLPIQAPAGLLSTSPSTMRTGG